MGRKTEMVRFPGTTTTQPKEHVMNNLSLRDRELVALGAALASNCIPCIEHHIPEARKAGLSDAQISEAIEVADHVRQVPARKVLQVAIGLLPQASAATQAGNGACAADAAPASMAARCCG
jgi:AhpD family alkylhydroperoxidase